MKCPECSTIANVEGNQAFCNFCGWEGPPQMDGTYDEDDEYGFMPKRRKQTNKLSYESMAMWKTTLAREEKKRLDSEQKRIERMQKRLAKTNILLKSLGS